jgi:low temperature requirement protein LtrA
MTDSTDAAPPLPEARRVDWIELFFDLSMVALITELAHGLHGEPGPQQFLTFAAWSIPAWWAWINVVVCVNQLPTLPRRLAGVSLLGATGTIGLMAASVIDSTDRVWAFALGNVVLRLILLVLWLYRARGMAVTLRGPLLYNGGTAVIWFVSIFVPAPWTFLLWAAAIAVEVLLLRAGSRSLSVYARVDIAHGSERLGLFIMILLGESVLSVVAALNTHWNGASAVAAAIGFAAICCIAWWFFVRGGNAIEEGLARLREQGDNTAMLDTVMFFPYLIVASVTMFAAGLATAVAHPDSRLSVGAAICLGGGLALLYVTNVIVMRSYQVGWGLLLPWALSAILLSLAIVAVGSFVPALISLILALVVATAVLAIAGVLGSGLHQEH